MRLYRPSLTLLRLFLLVWLVAITSVSQDLREALLGFTPRYAFMLVPAFFEFVDRTRVAVLACADAPLAPLDSPVHAPMMRGG